MTDATRRAEVKSTDASRVATDDRDELLEAGGGHARQPFTRADNGMATLVGRDGGVARPQLAFDALPAPHQYADGR